jgi:protein involved in polysaccharide export with SLBB domain
MAAGDFNEDGRNDLCAASTGEGINVWLGAAVIPSSGMALDVRQIPTTNIETIIEKNDVFTTVEGIPLYRIGAGDELEITLWRGIKGEKETVLVRPDGNISFGFIEDLDVRGLTSIDLDNLLTDSLKAFFKSPKLDVVVKKPNSKFVTMMGAIDTPRPGSTGPGRYVLQGKTTLLEMLNVAGGPTDDANLNLVLIRRKDGRSSSVNLLDAITRGTPDQNIILDDGDFVTISSISKVENRVYVYGEVGKPGMYTFTGQTMQLFDAISQAGGVTPFAREINTKIVRGDISKPTVISVNLKRLIEQGDQTQNLYLANGDLVYVPKSFVGDINKFMQQISPLIRLIITPAIIRDTYLGGQDLRLNLP